MKLKVEKNKKGIIIGVAVGVSVIGLVCCILLAKLFFMNTDSKKKRNYHMVKLVKPPPPPPPPPKEKPPPPPEKKEIVEKKQDDQPEEMDKAENEPPPGDLGLDADGTAGADGFGLRARKGGRSLLGSDSKNMYAWYVRIIQDEIRNKMTQYLKAHGGIPEGDRKAYIRIDLDEAGNIVAYNIYKSSGNKRIDEALNITLKLAQISEPPPFGMPRTMKLKITSKG